MSDASAPVPIKDGTVRRLFDDPEFRVAKRGYHPDDVAAFLDDIGARMMKLIGRLQGAEQTAETAQTDLQEYRQRVRQAESSQELFDRTLGLAEETANASVADAKARAHRLEAEAQRDARRMVDETKLRIERMMDAARVDVQRVYEEERQSIAGVKSRIRSESDQLETLRLAVAAETMALEEVRNEMRRRIRRAATDLLGVAESPDCLGTPVTRGIPEVVARQSQGQVEQEASVPDAKATPAIPQATESAPAPAPSTPDPTASVEPAHEARASSRPIDLVDPPKDAPVTVDHRDAAGPDAEDVFDRFMSDDIEEEPSRSWILA
jgi:DivIVA domain-containing protein